MLDVPQIDALSRRPGMKWGRAGDNVLAAWVADMDFPVPPPVRQALVRRIDTDLGYPLWTGSGDGTPLREAFADRMSLLYGLAVDPSQVREFTDVNQALQVTLQVATRPGDGVALHTPAYPPFLKTIEGMGRHLVSLPLTTDGQTWTCDPAPAAGCRALLLVNPQNPTGRVFTRAELLAVAEVAEAHDLLVISDEIHADLTYAPHRHIPFATLCPERTVTLTSATKAFNLAGIRCAVAHIGSAALREALARQPEFLFGEVSVLGVEATLAAWAEGAEWLAAVRARLARNRHAIAEALGPHGVGYRPPEATYLAWLDLRALALGPDPATFFLEEARVKLSGGPAFGPGGEGFARLNFATSSPVLDEILRRMTVALSRR